MFVEEDDVIRYVDFLMVEDYEDDLEIFEVDLDVVVVNCQMYGYFYFIVFSDEFVIFLC